MPETASYKVGVNVGRGVDFIPRSDLKLELGVDYHTIFESGNDIFFIPLGFYIRIMCAVDYRYKT